MLPMLLRSFILVATFCALSFCTPADDPSHVPPPDDRYKADILLVIAHPDDETAVTGYLARAIFDEHKRVAVIYGTRGNSGGNAVGFEQAASLAAVREIEGRRALASFGISNVWFLGGPDTPGQDVLRSLETWNHGAALDQTVRLIRLARPDVILTWLPAYSAGENHGDHQAAGVIATEAFGLAGDPTVFPEQVTPPRNRDGISNLTEGLRAWQPQKLYYFTDAAHTEFLQGKGPTYATTDQSSSKGMPYYKLVAEQMSFHLTQGDTGQFAANALKKGDLKAFKEPVRFVFGKSLVGGNATDEIFSNVKQSPIDFVRDPGYQAHAETGFTAEFGGPWAFYKRFWTAHGLNDLRNLLAPEVGIGISSTLSIPVLIHNGTDQTQAASVHVTVPQGWESLSRSTKWSIEPHTDVPVEVYLKTPAKIDGDWQKVEVTVENESGGEPIHLPLRVNLTQSALPQ
jgi:LmbE family N-acetylglucosaminyl deacetylase